MLAFFETALPYAEQAHEETDVLVSVVLSQWADETAFGGPDWSVYHNPGNVGDPAAGGQTTYSSLQTGVEAYIRTMNNGLYQAVKAQPGYQGQCLALGDSPWAGGHYIANGVKGLVLIQIIQEQGLTVFDGPAPPGPTPGPTPPAGSPIVKPLTGRYGTLNAPIVAVVPTPSGEGYTLVGADGGTFDYGDAPFLGSLAGKPLNAPIVDAVRTPDGKGLVLVGTDGGIFTFGDAPFEGSEGGTKLNAPVVSIGLTPDGKGYWLVAADGGVFTFGDAPFAGTPA
jgi:hypothetical protein